MIRGLSGSLLSHDALLSMSEAFAVRGDDLFSIRALNRWHRSIAGVLGPTAGARTVFDRVAVPLFTSLGCRVLPAPGKGSFVHGLIAAAQRTVAALLVTGWDADLGAAWRDAVRHGIANDVRWCFAINGSSLRVVDARRSYSRRHAEFAIAPVIEDPAACRVLYLLLNAGALAGGRDGPTLDAAVAASERFRAEVRKSLQVGVHAALTHLLGAFARASRRRRTVLAASFDESLIVVYRVLFLLFAEARGLVPRWHPTFRESYTIESLCEAVEREARPRGVWEAVQAIARLAHRGCSAGSLRVPPFNGRLFSPADAPLADVLPLDDGAVREALLALTTRSGASGRQRISYGDLGVEHLGGVYERLLEFKPVCAAGSAPVLAHAERRRSTGSFYTPRALTEFLVRRTLAPLVERSTAEQILSLRVVDPAMGSGAFLVAACRYLASAYEQALLREGVIGPGDAGDAERAAYRRSIAQRCLFGVDVNPMAVQLGRLSLWLATLSADRPLTFLDHHLRCGNSVVGAAIGDLLRQAPGRSGSRDGARLPLFAMDDADAAVAEAVAPRIAIALEPGDTIEQVRAKERALARVTADRAPLSRWKRAADLWCAGWFCENRALASRRTFGALLDLVLHERSALPLHSAEALLEEARATARRVGCFHWTLEFPEVFFADGGAPAGNPGFDAVLGNPPWAVLRGDRGDAAERRRAHAEGEALTAFARTAGIYRFQGSGHANLYQLFLERALSLLRRGGRLGIVLPSGFANDAGCSALRRHVLDCVAVDSLVGVENRDGVFPIHRGLKFLLLGGTTDAPTSTLPSRFGVRSPDTLESMPDIGPDRSGVAIPRALIQPPAGSACAIPELKTGEDLSVFSTILSSVPAFGSRDGWNLRFSRELNATDDRKHFTESKRGLPVLEGKQVQPFSVDVNASRYHVAPAVAARLLGTRDCCARRRLAYRDVASAGNRLTLIAAIVPAGAVTTHTLFCLRDEPRDDVHLFLCGVFNSYVANYLVRLRVGTHVTAGIVDWLPVPRPARPSAEFAAVVHDARRLVNTPHDRAVAAHLQALCARLYRLSTTQFRHVLDSFPLIDPDERRLPLECWAQIPHEEPR